MDKIEWDTPLMSLVPQIRRLQFALNMLSYHEFCDAMGWQRDDYSKAKFTALQEVGRILGNCDDHTLSAPVTAYELREKQYEQRRAEVAARLEATGHSRPADAPMQDANIPLQPYAMERGRERHTKGGPA